MKVVVLAGGLGTRLSEETQIIPKPMVQIGGKPILWHIMKIYSSFGYNDFIVLTGYKSHVIKEFFVNYYQRYSDITVDMAKNSVEVHRVATEPWRVTLLYTGEGTMTGGRLARAKPYLGDEPFMLTYGDGVADVDIDALVKCHAGCAACRSLPNHIRAGCHDAPGGLASLTAEGEDCPFHWVASRNSVVKPG